MPSNSKNNVSAANIRRGTLSYWKLNSIIAKAASPNKNGSLKMF